MAYSDQALLRSDPAPKRAARGAQVMDERKPGWHEHVDTATLDIASASRCVIAQAFDGSFAHGLNVVDKDHTLDLQAHGFADRYTRGRSDALELEAAWAAEINTRRYGSAHPPFWTRLRVAVRRRLRITRPY